MNIHNELKPVQYENGEFHGYLVGKTMIYMSNAQLLELIKAQPLDVREMLFLQIYDTLVKDRSYIALPATKSADESAKMIRKLGA